MINNLKRCQNKCIFCFIDQNPKNLRKALYVKDDDFIESFENGNFITLTNLNLKDIENIIKYKLSPLYISFHSSDENIRNLLFGNKKNKKSIDFLRILDKNNIKTHIQIVLCPEINDKLNLINTLNFLIYNFKNILSIGIVPVGITKYNKNPLLKPFNKSSSKETINLINEYRKDDIKNKSKIFLSDEFYIIANYKLPEYSYYEKFYQIQNGIGLCSNFIYEFDKEFFKLNKEKIIKNKNNNKKNINDKNKDTKIINVINENEVNYKNINILILTSEYFYKLMSAQILKYKSILSSKLNLNFNIKVDKVKNKFFGGNVKIAGLLTYFDFYNYFLKNNLSINKINTQDDVKINKLNMNIDNVSIYQNNYDKIIIPDIIFNNDGLTLDNKTKNDFLEISKKIKIIKSDGKSIVRELTELLMSNEMI